MVFVVVAAVAMAMAALVAVVAAVPLGSSVRMVVCAVVAAVVAHPPSMVWAAWVAAEEEAMAPEPAVVVEALRLVSFPLCRAQHTP